MKVIKCSQCDKKVTVADDYEFKTCTVCLTKNKAKYEIKKALKSHDKDAKKLIKSLKIGKISPIFRSYSAYVENYKKLFKKTPTFEEYEQALKSEKLQLAYAESERIRKEGTAKKHRELPDEFEGEPIEDLDEDDLFDDLRNNNTLGDYLKNSKPIERQKAQFEKQTNDTEIVGSNAWHKIGNEDPNPIHKISNQNRLKAEFFDRAE